LVVGGWSRAAGDGALVNALCGLSFVIVNCSLLIVTYAALD